MTILIHVAARIDFTLTSHTYLSINIYSIRTTFFVIRYTVKNNVLVPTECEVNVLSPKSQYIVVKHFQSRF